MKLTFATILAAASMVVATPHAGALTVYALTDNNHLLRFDSASPGTVVDTAITGLPATTTLVNMKMRTTVQPSGAANPGVGSLWALGKVGSDYRLFVISTGGAAQQIGSNLTALAPSTAGEGNWGFAFNPATDRFQAVGVNYNFTIDPNTATAVRDTDVFTAQSMFPAFSGAAYTTTSYGGPSQFYIVNAGDNHNLCTSTNIIAGGLISEAGATMWGIGLSAASDSGFDISGSTALLATNGVLYNVNISTGVATMIGNFPAGTIARALAIQPASFPAPFTTTVKIKGSKKVTTTKTSLVIKGTATSGAGITQVQYKIGSGKFKKAKGTTNWKFTAKLKPGTNTISVKAIGGNGVASSIAKVKVKVVTPL
jgi:hypothetical protein